MNADRVMIILLLIFFAVLGLASWLVRQLLAIS